MQTNLYGKFSGGGQNEDSSRMGTGWSKQKSLKNGQEECSCFTWKKTERDRDRRDRIQIGKFWWQGNLANSSLSLQPEYASTVT